MLGGHPRALSTLFFTEMWERFTFYGMRALLVLFLVDAVESGGYGFDDKTATAIYGLYTAAVFMAALPGGWIADRLIGAQRAVMVGGTELRILLAAGSIAAAAYELGISETTAHQHLSGLYRRTGCLNAVQAAYLLGRYHQEPTAVIPDAAGG